MAKNRSTPPVAADPPDELTTAEAAVYLHMSVRTLQRRMAHGDIAFIHTDVPLRGRVMFRREHLDDWIARSRREVVRERNRDCASA